MVASPKPPEGAEEPDAAHSIESGPAAMGASYKALADAMIEALREAGFSPPPPPPPPDPHDALRKFRAKRHNEHLKAIYSLTNTLGATIIGASYILPEIQGVKVIQELDRPSWIMLGLLVVAAGHVIIRWGTRRED